MTATAAVHGLGEAGAVFATGLSKSRPDLGYDPSPVSTPEGVGRADSVRECVEHADLVLCFVPAGQSRDAFSAATLACRAGTLCADCGTARPQQKLTLEHAAHGAVLGFADVAVMAPLHWAGFAGTPLLASGSHATVLTEALTASGGRVEVIDGSAGAAGRKLLRSMVTKGVAALLIESLQAAAQQGDLAWLSQHVSDTLSSLTAETLAGFLDGTLVLGEPRIAEEDAATMAEQGGSSTHMTQATVKVSEALHTGGGIVREGPLL